MTKIVKTGYYGLDDLDGMDTRSKDWKNQRETFGFDDTELWSLGDTIVNFSLPRIREMMKIESETNANFHKIENDYLKLIEGLELFVRNNGSRIFTKKEKKKVDKALVIFSKMLPRMWY